MLFNSLDFLIFLAVVLLLVHWARHGAQNWILLAASCLYCGWQDWRFLVPLFFVATVAFIAAPLIEDAPSIIRKRRRWP